MRLFSLALIVALLPTTAAEAQQPYTDIEWWHPLAATAGVVALFAVDEPFRDFMQDIRSTTTDDIGNVTKKFKDPPVYWVSGGAAIAVGLAAREPAIARTGSQILLSYWLSAGMMIATKWALGRTRPSDTPDDPFEWNLLEGGAGSSFPSGSAANVFSLATTLSDAIDHPAATAVLYTGATLNAWSRLNSDRHWLSDVVLGGLYGVVGAKIVNGRWRVFGLRPPSLLIGPEGDPGLQFSIAF